MSICTVTEKRRRKSAIEGRMAMIEATLRCLAKNGYHATSTRRIAEEAGVTASLVKHYFSGKAELILESYKHFRQKELAVYRSAANGEFTTATDKLDAYVACLLTYNSEQNRTLMPLWISFLEPVIADPEISKVQENYYDAILGDYRDMLRGVFEERAEVPDADEIARLALSINSLLDGIWLEMSLNPRRIEAEQALSTVRKAISSLIEEASGNRRL